MKAIAHFDWVKYSISKHILNFGLSMKYLELVLVLFFCSTIAQHQAQTTIIDTFEHDGVMRDYILYIPATLQVGAPLVFNLHGYTEGATIQSIYCEMNDVADTHGFAVCYPDGTNDSFGLPHWNAGLVGDTVDDLGFLTSLAEALQVEHYLDPERTFSCGISNGGMMSYHLACNAPETFKAVASVAGSMTTPTFNNCDSAPAVPIFSIHGTLDLVVPYNGADIPLDGWGTLVSNSEIMSFWNTHNSCSDAIAGSLENISLLDFSTVDTWKWHDCAGGNQNWLYRVNGGGHNWPGALPVIALGNTNQDFHASEAIWEFFSQCQPIVGVEDESQNTSPIYPNPASDQICGFDGEFELLSVSGKKVFAGNSSGQCTALPTLSSGIYILKHGPNFSLYQRLVID